MSILIALLTVVLVLISVFIVFIVLLQKPRADSGLGTAMGGGVAEAAFGSETGNVLTRATIVSSIAFFILAFGLYLAQIYVSKHKHAEANPTALPTVSAPASTTPAPEPAPAVVPPAPAQNQPAPAPEAAPKP